MQMSKHLNDRFWHRFGRFRLWLPAAALLTVLLVAAACGQSSTPTATPAPTSTAVTTPDSERAADSTPESDPPAEPTEQAVLPTPSPNEAGRVGTVAPEIRGVTSWLNSEPLTLAGLRGQVVLVDFWTYTCVNCIRTLPYLRDWHAKYSDNGLVILGIHTPEFEFEKVRENVARAIETHELGWAVAQDNDFLTWRAFNNRFWPAKYLIDSEGYIRYRHFGEGKYDETEQEIRKLLEDAGYDVSNIQLNSDEGQRVDPQARSGTATGQTRELYAGTERNRYADIPYIGNEEYYGIPLNSVQAYQDPIAHINHLLYLQGEWINGPESLQHARTTENLEDYIALKFFGTSVNVVIDAEGADPFDVVITIADEPVPQHYQGSDIIVDEDGTTAIRVDEPRMYNLVQLPEYGGHELKLLSNSEHFSVFAFTFGSYSVGP